MNDNCAIPAEQTVETATDRRRLIIGLPRCADAVERRFPLTPETVRSLCDRGFRVKIEAGAAATIHYEDSRYLAGGAEIVSRSEALSCDIVLHISPLPSADVAMMRRGAMLLTLSGGKMWRAESVKSLLSRSVIAVALDRVKNRGGNRPFADILSEVDGRAAIVVASSKLADADSGKGILLGGVSGVVSCEVTVLGCGIAAIAAAQSALGLGAQVRMFDDDVYALRDALRQLGPGVVGSALHRHVVENALRSADVVIATDMRRPYPVGSDLVSVMKREVLTLDLTSNPGSAFPSLCPLDLGADADETPYRRCLVRAGCAVPRTSAMAMSDTLSSLLDEILTVDGVTNALKLSPGLQAGVLTFLGRPVSPDFAALAGMRPLDLSLFIQMS